MYNLDLVGFFVPSNRLTVFFNEISLYCLVLQPTYLKRRPISPPKVERFSWRKLPKKKRTLLFFFHGETVIDKKKNGAAASAQSG